MVVRACASTRTESLGVKIATATSFSRLVFTTIKALLRKVGHSRVGHSHSAHLQKSFHNLGIERHIRSWGQTVHESTSLSTPHIITSTSAPASTSLFLHATVLVESFVPMLRVVFFAIVISSLFRSVRLRGLDGLLINRFWLSANLRSWRSARKV